jgi:phospholipid/cholesterol/gamma-HCH transport system ATP-binding protein
MINISHVNLKINHKEILKDITINIPDDRKTIIIGKSGCGKTMLMKTLEGLHRPQSGTIKIDGIEITPKTYTQRGDVFDKIAMLFQYAALLDSFTVFQNIALPLRERRQLSEADINEKVSEMLCFVNLEHSANLYPSELSGGMRKRIGLARAMVTNPRYLILDEPTTGLDPLTAEEVMTFLEMVISSKDVIPITITHDPYCINKLGDYIIMIDNGSIIFSGNKSELEQPSESPEHKFFRSFFI